MIDIQIPSTENINYVFGSVCIVLFLVLWTRFFKKKEIPDYAEFKLFLAKFFYFVYWSWFLFTIAMMTLPLLEFHLLDVQKGQALEIVNDTDQDISLLVKQLDLKQGSWQWAYRQDWVKDQPVIDLKKSEKINTSFQAYRDGLSKTRVELLSKKTDDESKVYAKAYNYTHYQIKLFVSEINSEVLKFRSSVDHEFSSMLLFFSSILLSFLHFIRHLKSKTMLLYLLNSLLVSAVSGYFIYNYAIIVFKHYFE